MKLYFLTQDTVGNAAASVNTNYQYVKHLTDAGYKAYILHEKTDYKGVSSWLDVEYSNLPHANIEGGELKVGPQDFVIIPELFAHVLEQLKDKKIWMYFIKSDETDLSERGRLREKATFFVLQEFARSNLLDRIYILDNKKKALVPARVFEQVTSRTIQGKHIHKSRLYCSRSQSCY